MSVERIEVYLDGTNRVTTADKEHNRYLITTYVSLSVGDTIYVKGKVRIPSECRNPGDFDYRNYLYSKGITYTVYNPEIEVVSHSNSIINTIKLFEVKNDLFDKFNEDKGIAAAVFCGDKSLVSSEIKDNYFRSNCSHVLAVSGTHFAGFLFILRKIQERKRINRALFISFYTILSIVICIFTGWSESVTRAAILSCCTISCKDRLSALGVAGFIMVIANPLCALSIGFRMSFIICLSIVYITPILEDKIGSFLAVIVACQLGSIPFWISLDMSIDLWNIFVSMIMSYLAQIACILFVPCVILSFLNSICLKPCNLILKVMNDLAKITSESSIMNYKSHNLSVITILTLTCIIIYILIKPSLMKRILKKISCILSCMYLIFIFINFIHKPLATIVFIDVGQGDSCLIMSGGNTLIIDGGTYNSGKTVENVLDYYGIVHIDIAIASHWDMDHAGGIMYLNEQGRINTLLAPSQIPDEISSLYETSEIQILSYNDSIILGNCVLRSINNVFEGDDNSTSIVLLSQISNTNILFTGDIPSDIESILMDRIPDIDILKAAHHGSKYSSSEEFLRHCMPEYTVISVGKFNNYGHPSSEVLERLKEINSSCVRTDECGAIIIDIYKDCYEVNCMINAH